jgi:hypothetical protein
MEAISYRPSLTEGTRVLLVHDKHQKHQSTATVIGALPNPSRMPVNQWYDIRFDDNTWGRFPERHLQKIPSTEMAPASVEAQSSQSSVA